MSPARAWRRIAALLLLLACAGLAAAGRGPAAPDPLAGEIARWSAWVGARTDSSDLWQQVRGASVPMLERAGQSLRAGRRLVALNRFGAARQHLAGYAYYSEHPAAGRGDSAVFAAEWARTGDSLRAMLGPRPALAARLRQVRPAAVRALAEGALLQARDYYDASRDYGNSTSPEFGLFYLGVARGLSDFVSLCTSLPESGSASAPAIRAIDVELDSLEARVLRAYRPPASIERHSEFIGVSASIKEARELGAIDLRYGALARYLLAVQRFAMFAPAPLDSATLARRLEEWESRLPPAPVDHSLGRLYLETARAEVAAAAAGTVPPTAIAIVTDVLPRYFAALEPAPAAAPRPRPQVTVTLVRWPYT